MTSQPKKNRLQINLEDDPFHIDIINVPETDTWIFPKKDNHIILLQILRKWVDENKQLTEKDYKRYFNIKIGIELPCCDEDLSYIEMDELEMKSNIFSEEDIIERQFELEKHYDEEELEWIKSWKWKKEEAQQLSPLLDVFLLKIEKTY